MAKKKNDAELVYTQQERNQQVIRSVHLIQNADKLHRAWFRAGVKVPAQEETE